MTNKETKVPVIFWTFLAVATVYLLRCYHYVSDLLFGNRCLAILLGVILIILISNNPNKGLKKSYSKVLESIGIHRSQINSKILVWHASLLVVAGVFLFSFFLSFYGVVSWLSIDAIFFISAICWGVLFFIIVFLMRYRKLKIINQATYDSQAKDLLDILRKKRS